MVVLESRGTYWWLHNSKDKCKKQSSLPNWYIWVWLSHNCYLSYLQGYWGNVDDDFHVVIQNCPDHENSASVQKMLPQSTQVGESFETWIKQKERFCKEQQKVRAGKNVFHSFLLNIGPMVKERSKHLSIKRFWKSSKDALKLFLNKKKSGNSLSNVRFQVEENGLQSRKAIGNRKCESETYSVQIAKKDRVSELETNPFSQSRMHRSSFPLILFSFISLQAGHHLSFMHQFVNFTGVEIPLCSDCRVLGLGGSWYLRGRVKSVVEEWLYQGVALRGWGVVEGYILRKRR